MERQHGVDPTLGAAFDAPRNEVLESLATLARKRGEILAGLNPRASESEARHIQERVERVDTSILRVVSENVSLFRGDDAFRKTCVTVARSAENTSRFLGLVDSFYHHGVIHGEAQGRVIQADRERTGHEHRVKLAVALDHLHDGAGEKQSLHHALDAARELGKRDGVVNRLHADVLASKIYRAIGGWRAYIPSKFSKDAAAVDLALDGLSRADSGLVEQAYRDLTGTELRGDLLSAFGPKRAAEFFLALHADDTAATALALKRELQNPLLTLGFRQEAIRGIYERLSKKEIQEVEASISPTSLGAGVPVERYVASHVSYSIAKEIAAYRAGDELGAKVAQVDRIMRSWLGRRHSADILRNIPAEERGAFEERYREVTGRDLRQQLEKHLEPSPLLELCVAILDRDERRIRVGEVACALAYRGDFIAGKFLGLSQMERESLIGDYKTSVRDLKTKGQSGPLTGDFDSDLRRAVWKEDYLFLSAFPKLCSMLDKCWWPTTGSLPFVESVVRNGKLSPAELLRYFMVGLGTDVEGIYAVLSNRSQSNIRAIEEDYERRYPAGPWTSFLGRVPFIKNFVLTGNLRHDLNVELSGDSEFDVKQMLRGFRDHSTPKQLCAHIYSTLVLRKNHETSGILARWARLAAMRGDSVVKRRYDQDFAAAEEYFKKHIAPSKHPPVECVVRFLTLARLTDIHANSFRETKNLLGDVFLNSGAFVGVVLGTTAVLALATFSYPIVASASFIGSLAWRLTIGRCVMGRGFGRGEVMFQSARAFIDGVSIFTVRVGVATLGQFIGGQLSKSAAKGGFKTGFNKMIKSMENRVRRQDKARHVLERSSVIQSNEDLRGIVQGYVAGIGDASWRIGQGAQEMFPPIESLLEEAPGENSH